jgi:DNA modification methylase
MTDFEIGGARVLLGDRIARMKGPPDKSVQTCVTSPPYFGIRARLPNASSSESRPVPTHECLGPDDCQNLQDRRKPAI